jgi:hypothetical protein
MGTPGVVGIGTPRHWQGVYNHYDSDHLAKALARYVQRYGRARLVELIRTTPQGFTSFPDKPARPMTRDDIKRSGRENAWIGSDDKDPWGSPQYAAMLAPRASVVYDINLRTHKVRQIDRIGRS